jgi:hypothetical protein
LDHDTQKILTEGTKYFFLSIVGMSVRSAFSQITYVVTDCDSAKKSRLRINLTHRDTIWILLPDPLSLSLAFLYKSKNLSSRYKRTLGGILTEGMLILEFRSHSESSVLQKIKTTRHEELRWWWFRVKHHGVLNQNNTRRPASQNNNHQHFWCAGHGLTVDPNFQKQIPSEFPLRSLL